MCAIGNLKTITSEIQCVQKYIIIDTYNGISLQLRYPRDYKMVQVKERLLLGQYEIA